MPYFPFSAVIFNLDGVLVDTAVHHFTAWRRVSNELGFDLTTEQHEGLRGLSRMASLEQILVWGGVYLSEAEKLHWADVKNNWYLKLIAGVTPENVLPGALLLLNDLRSNGVALALSSASRSAKNVLHATGLEPYFDVVVDGYSTRKSKPDPECFLLASKALGKTPSDCLIFEDSYLGVKAALFGGFNVVGIGRRDYLQEANAVLPGFVEFSMEKLATILTEVTVHAV